MSTAGKFEDDSSRKMTRDEYLKWEDQQPRPHDYSGGMVYAQAGASRNHNRIVSNLVRRLDEQLEDRPCDVFSGDMRLWVESCDSYYYPDLLVACGDIQFASDVFDTLVNPLLIVEIFSRSTRGVDLVRKRRDYRTIPSLVEYLLIDQYSVGIECLRRIDGEHWDSVEYLSLSQTIELTSIGCVLQVADIYRRVEFNEQPTMIDDE